MAKEKFNAQDPVPGTAVPKVRGQVMTENSPKGKIQPRQGPPPRTRPVGRRG